MGAEHWCPQRARTSRGSSLSTAAPSEAAASRGYRQGTGGELLRKEKKKCYLINNKQEEFAHWCLERGRTEVYVEISKCVCCQHNSPFHNIFINISKASRLHPTLSFSSFTRSSCFYQSSVARYTTLLQDRGTWTSFRPSCKRKVTSKQGNAK